MRFSVFVALLTATFVSCCSGFASTENSAAFASEVNEGRRLHSEAAVNSENAAKIAARFNSNRKESLLLKKATAMIKAANGDDAAIKKAMDLAAFAKNGAKVSDDQIAKISAMLKTAKGDEADTMKVILAAIAKDGAKISDETTALLATKIAGTVTKNAKSWPRLRRFAKITLGAGGLAMYGAYKLMFDNNSQAATATTTTTG
ncbi:hypothetical protein PI124_g12688 [Phytophthora idaei]|nr:hypothetical protein PI125_g15706 [Phytophthora idaei]KAG3152700.1 hypothetical protein PI126_g10411 [Phytophthora idaei]KAG3242479.1 hypothetical protein PI124_g12688 [Phytophthora idaei]